MSIRIGRLWRRANHYAVTASWLDWLPGYPQWRRLSVELRHLARKERRP